MKKVFTLVALLLCFIYISLCICRITKGIESQSQSESQCSPSDPSDNRKEYREILLDSLNLPAQEALLTSKNTGDFNITCCWRLSSFFCFQMSAFISHQLPILCKAQPLEKKKNLYKFYCVIIIRPLWWTPCWLKWVIIDWTALLI